MVRSSSFSLLSSQVVRQSVLCRRTPHHTSLTHCLRRPIADQTPIAAIKSQLFANLIEESLAEYSYDAALAGLSYDVGNETDGLQLIVSGYSDKLAMLLTVVLEKLKNFQVDPSRFALVHDRLCRAYANAKLNNPSTLADSFLRHLTRETHWTFDERLEALAGTPSFIFSIRGCSISLYCQVSPQKMSRTTLGLCSQSCRSRR